MTKEEYLELENIKKEARYEKWRAFKQKANDSIKNTFHGEVGSVFWCIGRLIDILKVVGATINYGFNQAFSSVANNRDNEVD